MRPYAEVIGDPIAHSKSPALHRFWLEAVGIDGDYRAIRVGSAKLQSYLDARRHDAAWRGCNITSPLKERAIILVDEVSDRARRIGAINLILSNNGRLLGDNCDLDGLSEAVPEQAVSGNLAILIGAGGAARAAFEHLLGCGAAHIQILARTPKRAHAMCQRLASPCPVAIDGFDAPGRPGAAVLVNASPMGMEHAPMPKKLFEHLSRMDATGLVFDMVYEPLETPLLASARSTGLRTTDGLAMLIGQAASAFEGFFKKAAPRELDEDLRQLLAEPRR